MDSIIGELAKLGLQGLLVGAVLWFLYHLLTVSIPGLTESYKADIAAEREFARQQSAAEHKACEDRSEKDRLAYQEQSEKDRLMARELAEKDRAMFVRTNQQIMEHMEISRKNTEFQTRLLQRLLSKRLQRGEVPSEDPPS